MAGCAPAKPAKSLVIQDKGCRALGGCAPAKPVKSLVVAYSYRWLPAPMRSGAGAEHATEPRAWSTTEPRGRERRFHNWVKRLAPGGGGPKPV